MDIDRANLSNLTGLWNKYGATALEHHRLPLKYGNIRWPHRYWFDSLLTNPETTAWLQNLDESVVIPVWEIPKSTATNSFATPLWQQLEGQLAERHWHCVFEQVAMYLAVAQLPVLSTKKGAGFNVCPVSTLDELAQWISIGSEAFAYSIDFSVIANLKADSDIKLLLGRQDDQAVACALLYKTGEVIGIHQVGVKQAFQGQGIAKQFMQCIVYICAQWGGNYLVLQASALGLPLYKRMGFLPQFTIKNYQSIRST